MKNSSNSKIFDSILSQEQIQSEDFLCRQTADRVAILYKILLNRKLFALKSEFDDSLFTLLSDFCDRLDNELCSSSTDSESEV